MKPELPTYPSMKSCAARTGLSVTFLKRCVKAGCPAFDRHGRVDLNKLLAWIPQVMESADNIPDGYDTSTAWLNAVRAKREEIRLAKDKGSVLDVEAARGQVAEAEAYYFAELDRLLREWPPALAGLTALEILERMKRFIAELRQRTREKFQGVVKS